MSIDALQLRHEIIRPVLKHLESSIPYSMAAENLLMGTCAQESLMGQFIVQLDNGRAKGIFQMEPATHFDIYKNYLVRKGDLYSIVRDLMGLKKYHLEESSEREHDAANLIGNLYYATAMARVHYYRVPMALPEADNVEQMANYWKLFYNTPEGHGTEEQFIERYARYVA